MSPVTLAGALSQQTAEALAVIAFVQIYVDRHFQEEPFQKRKRKRWSDQDAGLGRRSSVPDDANHSSQCGGRFL